MTKFLKEPLFHFMLIGAALFFLFYRLNGPGNAEHVIIIDDSDLDRIVDSWEMQWNSAPTKKELQGLLRQHIRQEVFYREALILNLDHNDQIVRRRLSQKMEFLSRDLAEMEVPTAEELSVFFGQNLSLYKDLPSFVFSHLYFNPDKRKDAIADARKILSTIPRGEPEAVSLKGLGDAFPYAAFSIQLDSRSLVKQMGSAFADAIKTMDTGKWYGPVQSGYGQHLVFIHSSTEGRIPEIEEVEEQLLTDYTYHLQKKYNESVYEALRRKYIVDLDVKPDALDKEFKSKIESDNK